MTDAKSPLSDPSAERRETYRLARRAYTDATSACQNIRAVLSRAADAAGALHGVQWPPAPITRRAAPPPMPGQDTPPQDAPMRLPTDDELATAIQNRATAKAAITAAWNAMSRAEQDDCNAPPQELNLQRKY